MNQMVIATHNPGKLKEFQTLLHGTNIKAIGLNSYNQPEPEETGSTFIENAIIKVRAACQLTGHASLADDSGLCIPALDGAPGVLSARYGNKQWTYTQKIEHLLNQLQQQNINNPRAFFYCAIVSMQHKNDPTPIIATAAWHGQITTEPRGEHGFGYDPIFWLLDEKCTAAELNHEDKASRSHRAKAFKLWLNLFQAQQDHPLSAIDIK